MLFKFKHGGRFRQAAIEEGLTLRDIVDYSTSINWVATKHFPNKLFYNHMHNTEYPEPTYNALREIIIETYGIPEKALMISNGANEAIAKIYHLLNLEKVHTRMPVSLIGATYSEYSKYAELNKFTYNYHDPNVFMEKPDKFFNHVVVIVNPSTPTGVYRNIRENIELILRNGSIVILDESFIDFVNHPSLTRLVERYPNLFIVRSLTKFYGSPGARLGLILNNKNLYINILNGLIPPWSVSAYDNWFYLHMIPKYKRIKADTLIWIKEESGKLKDHTNNSQNITYKIPSETSFHTMCFKEEFLMRNNIQNFQRFLLRYYGIYVRPTADFWGCHKGSFRVGLRLPEENEPLWKALKEIG